MTRFVLYFCAVSVAVAQVSPPPVTTRSGDNLRHGAFTAETQITPQTVSGLHLKYSVNIPNDKRGLEAQPLVLYGVPSPDKKTHDLLVLATMANDILACDLHSGKTLWTLNLGNPIQGSAKIDFWNINDHWGILSTPVIDPDTRTLYAVTWTSPDGSPEKGWHSLHSVNLSTGKETHTPLSMNPLTYNPGHGLKTARFADQMRKQRSALLLETVQGHKTVFFASGSVLETAAGASGWVAAADLATWRFTASWASTARTYGGGIWMAGQGLSADSNGDLYALTGNGGFDGVTDFGESFIKLHYSPPADKGSMGTIQIADWWSPWSDAGRVGQKPTLIVPAEKIGAQRANKLAGTNNATMHLPVNHGHLMAESSNGYNAAAYNDQDLGSGSVVVIPSLHLIGGAGKDGIWYSVNQQQMGKTMPSDFADPIANYAKLLAPPVWFTYAAFKHDAKGNVIGYEDPAPQNVVTLDFNYDGLTHHMHSTPVVYESTAHGTILFCWGENGNLRAWQVLPTGTLLFLGNSSQVASPNSPNPPGGMPGGMLALSSNGGKNGIVWALVPQGDANKQITGGNLYAFDAQNFGTYSDGEGSLNLLWQSPVAFTEPKFNVPVIADGLVIVPTYSARVDVYGLN